MPQQIYFVYASPLDRDRRKVAEQKTQPYPSVQTVIQSVEDWKKTWEKINKDDQIMTALSQLTGTTLPYPLEANIIGGMLNSMSRPLILSLTKYDGSLYTEAEFADVCIHEITHRFCSPMLDYPGMEKYWNYVKQEAYLNEPFNTQNHIIIYALLHELLPKFVGAEAWEACKTIKQPTYQRAFDIMMEKGAKTCIAEFKSYVQS